tara:strand:+ start:307 stop:456 length:150 start_codon:yes stop_codon:yes gene_type:complete
MSALENYVGLLEKIKEAEKPKKDCFCVSAKIASGKIPDCDCPNSQIFKL